jgi:glycosyltransferase involved in cell wall biosynthesis
VKVLLVTHYFPPEVGAPQARLSEMARHWASSGIDVTVVTGMPNHPTGVVPSDYRGAVVRREERDGVRILRSWLYATPNEGFVKKTLGHLSFMVSSVLLSAPRTGPADVVVVSSPTFFSIASAWLIARLRRARLVVEIRDLWPAIFVELGVLTNRPIIAILERLELAAYRAADAVVVVSEGFRSDLIRRGVPADKVTTIRNGVDLDRFSPDLQPDPVDRRWLGAGENDLLVLYLGAHGISQGLSSVIEAAALLDDEPVHVALVGEGADKPAVRAHLEQVGATNVTMLAGVPRERVPALLAAADVCLVPLRDLPLFSTFIPSKMFEYLGAGKAVVGSVRGETARILEEAGAVVVPPEDPRAMAAALRELAADPERRARMGARGRDYVQQHFDRRMLAEAYSRLLLRLVGMKGKV